MLYSTKDIKIFANRTYIIPFFFNLAEMGNTFSLPDENSLLSQSAKTLVPMALPKFPAAVQDGIKKAKEAIDKWKSQEVHIAIIGRSGTGKSTIMNSLRGIDHWDRDHPDRCEVGSVETTEKVSDPFPFPLNNKVRLYDLPGAGTQKFPIRSYEKDVEMDKYDAFIILCKDRFLEADGEVVKVNIVLENY